MRQVMLVDDQQGQEQQQSDQHVGQKQWQNVKARLQSDLGMDAFRSWFAEVAFVSLADDCVELCAPTRFIRDWIVSHYEDRLRTYWAHENENVHAVSLILRSDVDMNVDMDVNEGTEITQLKPMSSALVTEEATESGLHTSKTAHTARFADAPALSTSSPVQTEPSLFVEARQGEAAPLGAPLDPRFTFEDFVVGASNELAYAAAKRVAHAPAQTYNPLYIRGQVGIGKTHLLHAIAWELKKRNPYAKILYLSAERFMYCFVQALRDRDIMTFKEQFRGVDILLMDDVQFIANKASTQEEFFHTFDALIGQNRQVVITADRAPSELEGVGERIRSRLDQGLAVDLGATDFELRLGILKKKLDRISLYADNDISVPNTVQEFLAHRITSNIRALEGAVTRLSAHAALVGRPVSLDLAKDVLADLLRSSDRKITIDDIQRCVTKYFSLTMADMLSPRRAREVARPRQIAMYLCKQLTTRSLPEIGRKFGGRDHTTVIHAVRRIEALRAADRVIEGDLETLKRKLGATQQGGA